MSTSLPLSPSRLSSEAPEVVPGQFLTTIVENRIVNSPSPSISQASTQLPGSHSRAASWLSSSPSDRKSRQNSTLAPQILYEDAAPYQPKGIHSRRVFSLVSTIVLVVIAFLIGGGLGGGITGAVMSSQKSKSGATTTSASAAKPTVIIDQAGCPLINNSTYTSSKGTAFITFCATAITATAGQDNDLSNSVQSSFDNCLDLCANTTGCIGASWYMFDPTTPSRNSVCFLKNGVGEEVSASNGLSVASGYLVTMLPSRP